MEKQSLCPSGIQRVWKHCYSHACDSGYHFNLHYIGWIARNRGKYIVLVGLKGIGKTTLDWLGCKK